MVRKYPNSEYAVSAKRKIDVGRDQLAAREMMVGRYYMERRDYAGAINRFKIVVTRYQTTRHVEEALLRLTEAYLSLGIVGEAQTSAAVLGHNFPDSRWYKDAYALVQQRGLQPSENRGSWISQAFRERGSWDSPAARINSDQWPDDSGPGCAALSSLMIANLQKGPRLGRGSWDH